MAGLYIHIPFCHSKCAYCDFFSTPRNEMSRAYVETLLNELKLRSGEITEPFETIYLGGGTPSSLSPALLSELIDRLPTENTKEFTIEVNPEDVNQEFIRLLNASPINRVSMGVQSLNDSELAFIGRRHSATDAIKAFNMLRDAGISNISLDLIYGLPGQTLDSWNDSLSQIIAMNPEHLSAYTLMLEPGTRLTAMASAGKFMPTDDATISRMYDSLQALTKAWGYEHYEISNFARPGFRSRHNSSYWDFTPYLGLGTSAHSFDGKVRRFNPANIKKYIESAGATAVIDPETSEEQANDYIMVRLRTSEGLSLNSLAKRFGESVANHVRKESLPLIVRGRLRDNNGTLNIPQELFLISDSIISDVMI